jgi:hypothetical protein
MRPLVVSRLRPDNGTKLRSCFYPAGPWCPMPALLAYILALVVLLGAGYGGLEWLAEPLPPHDSGIRAGKDKVAAAKAEAHRDAADGTRSPGHEPSSSTPTSRPMPTEPRAAAATRSDADEPNSAASSLAGTPAQAPGDVPQGGCMPIGITVSGKLVFPMACQAVLAQGRDRPTPRAATATASPAERAQAVAAPEARPSDPGQPPNGAAAPTDPPPSDATAHSENEPSHARVMKPAAEGADEAGPRKRMAARDVRPSHPKGVMMILRTIEFPDGHREQRLMSMNQWRRTAYQAERW